MKFRDEIRPRFGLMRGREFIMKDAYSFDATDEGAMASYRRMYDAYARIFNRCGLKNFPVEADTGVIGGNYSHEFMVPAETGENDVVYCEACGYAANIEKATSGVPATAARDPGPAPEKFATPGVVTIEALAKEHRPKIIVVGATAYPRIIDFPRARAIVMYEQMQRSWLHQDEIDGRSRFNSYRKPQNITIGPRNIGQATPGFAKGAMGLAATRARGGS